MATYEKAPREFVDFANAILCEFDTHKRLLDAKVRVDYVFARASLDKWGEPKGPAIMHHGVRALGYARIIGLKDRAMGRGDAEIVIDGDWWLKAKLPEQKALLDHELHHISVRETEAHIIKRDDLDRPLLQLRPHDFEFGQFYWPDLCKK